MEKEVPAVFERFKKEYDVRESEEMSLQEYLERCARNPLMYASPAEHMLHVMGDPEIIDTRKDPRLSRIFANREIKILKTFSKFYGMETTIERIFSYFRHSAQGLEEKKQILYLLGPVGGGKSSLAEHLKSLFERTKFYTLKAGDTVSPVYEPVTALFSPERDGDELFKRYGIPPHRLLDCPSPWAAERLKEFEGDVSKFRVVAMRPSRMYQVGIVKTEPGDENSQDITTLVGKPDLHKLERYPEHHPDAYNYFGALNRARMMLEFVEMFKAPIKMLHPLLTATQERNYKGSEGVGAFPFEGIIVAHSNESEWLSFKGNTTNEAFMDRVYTVKVPYCLRVSEEVEIYKKLLSESELHDKPCAPGTLEMMAQFAVLSRLKEHENSSLESKMRIYNGENLKDIDPKAKTIQEYRDMAGVDEGMTGLSTRFSYKILARTFNYDYPHEVAANPVHLLYVLEQQVEQEQFPEELENRYTSFIMGILAPRYAEYIGKEIQRAYLDSYSEYGQNIFDRYVTYADYWIQDEEYRDPDTGEIFDRGVLNEELEKIEKPAGISNPKDFRNEIVQFVLRARAQNNGNNPEWTSYEKLREVIEKKMFANTEELLPVISFQTKSSKEKENQHEDFVQNMVKKGYTERQVRLLCEWYLRVRKSS